jgi:hypothetical protein
MSSDNYDLILLTEDQKVTSSKNGAFYFPRFTGSKILIFIDCKRTIMNKGVYFPFIYKGFVVSLKNSNLNN